MSKLTACVVGGGAGGQLSLRALHRSDRFDLVAATDMRQEVCDDLAAKFPGLKTFTSHEAMFDACKTDVVCVSTWPPSHRPITLEALDKLPLKGLLVEKPLGDTAQAGRDILDAIKAKGLPVAVPHGLLALNHTREIIKRVAEGVIGNVELVEMSVHQWDIMNAGIHWANFFCNVTGLSPIEWVMCATDKSTRTFRDGMQVETMGITYVQNANKQRFVMQTGDSVQTLGGFGTPWRIVGDAGTIRFDAWGGQYHLMNESTGGKYELVKVEMGDTPPHQKHLEAMADQIESGNLDYSVADSSQMALEICEAAYVSARHGCMVTFPLADFTPPGDIDWDPGLPYSGEGGGRDGRKLDD